MKQDFRKVKKQDLYPILDLVQSNIVEAYLVDTIFNNTSEYYGVYKMELCFILNNSTENTLNSSQLLWDEFKKLYCGYKQIHLKEFPPHYPEEVVNILGAEIVGIYISTERLNSLPMNDDLRLAKFILKNINLINKLIRKEIK